MLAEFYIEALLIDPVSADSVWEAWNADEISDDQAAIAWIAIASGASPGCSLWEH